MKRVTDAIRRSRAIPSAASHRTPERAPWWRALCHAGCGREVVDRRAAQRVVTRRHTRACGGHLPAAAARDESHVCAGARATGGASYSSRATNPNRIARGRRVDRADLDVAFDGEVHTARRAEALATIEQHCRLQTAHLRVARQCREVAVPSEPMCRSLEPGSRSSESRRCRTS